MRPYGSATAVAVDRGGLIHPTTDSLHPVLSQEPAAFSFPCVDWSFGWRAPSYWEDRGDASALLWATAHASIAWSTAVTVDKRPERVSRLCFQLAVIDKAVELHRLSRRVRLRYRPNPSSSDWFKAWRKATECIVPWAYQLAVLALGNVDPPASYSDTSPLVEGAVDLCDGVYCPLRTEAIPEEYCRPFDLSIIKEFDVPLAADTRQSLQEQSDAIKRRMDQYDAEKERSKMARRAKGAERAKKANQSKQSAKGQSTPDAPANGHKLRQAKSKSKSNSDCSTHTSHSHRQSLQMRVLKQNFRRMQIGPAGRTLPQGPEPTFKCELATL